MLARALPTVAQRLSQHGSKAGRLQLCSLPLPLSLPCLCYRQYHSPPPAPRRDVPPPTVLFCRQTSKNPPRPGHAVLYFVIQYTTRASAQLIQLPIMVSVQFDSICTSYPLAPAAILRPSATATVKLGLSFAKRLLPNRKAPALLLPFPAWASTIAPCCCGNASRPLRSVISFIRSLQMHCSPSASLPISLSSPHSKDLPLRSISQFSAPSSFILDASTSPRPSWIQITKMMPQGR